LLCWEVLSLQNYELLDSQVAAASAGLRVRVGWYRIIVDSRHVSVTSSSCTVVRGRLWLTHPPSFHGNVKPLPRSIGAA
jgi:hypothetical protein